MPICDPDPQTPQIPQDLENQLAGPGGQFPGTAETLATPVGSDKPIRVKIGQQANKHLQLSQEEYRARSAQQKEIDNQVDPNANPIQEPQLGTNPSAAAKNVQPPAPTRKKPGRPKGAKSKPRPAVPKAHPIGQPYPVPSTTAAPTPPVPIPTSAMFEDRMSRLERGMDMLVRAIAERDKFDARRDPVPAQDASEALAELDEELQDDFDPDVDDEPTPGESSDGPPMVVTDVDHATKTVAATVSHAKNEPELDKGLQELQQMILKRNPQKVFRQYWCQLSRAAQYNEWPPERREAFDGVFNSMVAHPKFVHQMSKFLRGSRSSNCIGNEQIARVCGMVAGFLTVYQLAAAGR